MRFRLNLYKITFFLLVLVLSVKGLLSIFKYQGAELESLYLILFICFIWACMLFYEYWKAYNMNVDSKEFIKGIIKDEAEVYTYTNTEDNTYFYLSAESVINHIKSDKKLTPLTFNKVKELKVLYSDSPKILRYLSFLTKSSY